jgi:hypothetical protein
MGWDREEGIPRRETLGRLDLEDIGKALKGESRPPA